MRRPVALPAALIAVSVAARLVSLHALHPLNWDEIEFFRATDWVRQGLVPYRDFWEHHTPLQWFLFAPVAALVRSPGVAAIIAMRWAQLPLWAATFALANAWMRNAGIERLPRWCALAVPLTSSVFMLPAVEYRVDVLAIALTFAGLVLLQRADRGANGAFAAGAAFALAGFANLRIAPALVVIMLLARVVRVSERKWTSNRRMNALFAGAAVTTAIGALYFAATRSLGAMVRHAFVENYLADRLAANVPGMFIHRIVAPFGIRILRPAGVSLFSPSALDLGGIVLVVFAAIGLVRVMVRRFRAPDDLFFVGAAMLTNLLFTAAMKVVFNYHLEVAAVLAVPLIASEIERLRARRALIAILAAATALNIAVALFRGKEDDLRYQDLIMREADRRTPPGSAVFDGTGWVLHRTPAYRYWFLREIVTLLERHGEFEPYTPEQMLADPPAAIVADHDVRVWLLLHPQLGQAMTMHYLPLWRDLWMPGLSARLLPGASARWSAPADGDYRVFASSRLAWHPWFRQPLDARRRTWTDPRVALTAADSSAPVEITIDGVAVSAPMVHLRRRAAVIATNRGELPIGIMLVRGSAAELFQQPAEGVTLEAAATPEWHVWRP